MRERGELRPDADPDGLALALLAAVQGGLLLNQTRRDAAPLEAAMDAMITYIRGFAAPDTGGVPARSSRAVPNRLATQARPR